MLWVPLLYTVYGVHKTAVTVAILSISRELVNDKAGYKHAYDIDFVPMKYSLRGVVLLRHCSAEFM